MFRLSHATDPRSGMGCRDLRLHRVEKLRSAASSEACHLSGAIGALSLERCLVEVTFTRSPSSALELFFGGGFPKEKRGHFVQCVDSAASPTFICILRVNDSNDAHDGEWTGTRRWGRNSPSGASGFWPKRSDRMLLSTKNHFSGRQKLDLVWPGHVWSRFSSTDFNIYHSFGPKMKKQSDAKYHTREASCRQLLLGTISGKQT